jgi:hypothetical protein
MMQPQFKLQILLQSVKFHPKFQDVVQVTAGRNNTNTSIIGATANYSAVHSVTMSSGTFITDQDVSGIRNVAVIGPK